MKEDIEATMIEFNNAAAKIYSILFKQFSESIHDIDRSEDENVFNMKAAKFTEILRYQLEQQAKEILEASVAAIHEPLQTSLSARVYFYSQEFQVKCKAL